MTRRPDISVVLPTLGNYDGLARVLGTYERQTLPRERFEVIVVRDVGDPEPERTDAAVGGRPYRIRRLQGSIPGSSANRNTGWKAAEASLILFTDNDTLASPRLLAEHLAWHEREPTDTVGVLGHVRWAREVRVTPFMHWLEHGMQFDFPNIKGIEAGWGRFYSANVSVKRTLLEHLGGYDEERLPYLYEDLDFGYRASTVGFRLLYNRRAEVEHLREMDLEFWRSKMGRLAAAERAFVRIHPEIRPYFHDLFTRALKSGPARGRGRKLLRLVPRHTPLLGKRIWRSADLYYRQALAPAYIAAWDSDRPDAPIGGPVAPYLLEREAAPRARASAD